MSLVAIASCWRNGYNSNRTWDWPGNLREGANMTTGKFGNSATLKSKSLTCTDFVNNSNITAALHLVLADPLHSGVNISG
ncbi:MAG: hypothetical protein WB988_18515 [Candidatus Nitrosopolaris sp.]